MKKELLKYMLLTICLLSSITACLSSCITTNADSFESEGIYYNITSLEDKTVKVSNINIDNYSSGSVIIPASVTNGGTTYSVTSIGEDAFKNCESLTSVEIPNSVTEIGQYAFYGCKGLTKFVVDSGNNNYTALDGVLFNKDKSTIVAYPPAKSSTSYTIPNSVTLIGRFAFKNCEGLTSVTIPNSVKKIGSEAFYECKNLKSIKIPNSVTEIGRRAFDYTPWYWTQTDGLVYAGLVAYKYNGERSSGTSVTIKEGTQMIGHDAFAFCEGLTSVTIPNSVTSIGLYAFFYCTDLTNVVIPNSVTKIGNGAFGNCSSLTSITIPNSVTEIGSWTFRMCTNLTKFVVDSGNNNYTALDGVLFNKDQTIIVSYPNAKSHKYTIPNSVTEIGDHAFSDCTDLTSVTIPNSVTKIGEGAFRLCEGLKSITIPNSVTEIGWGTFRDCSGLTSVVIPNSVTKIGEDAFIRCESLTSVTIPDSVTEIGEDSFWGCTGLKEIYNYSESPQSISEDTFGNVDTQTCILYVPEGTVEAYRASDGWRKFLNIKEFTPQKVVKK